MCRSERRGNPEIGKHELCCKTIATRDGLATLAFSDPFPNMSLSFDILGTAGHDNALLVRVDTGHSVDRLLFDCGDGCLDSVAFGEMIDIDHVLFSHLHMDHVSGFGQFFRSNLNRVTKANRLWGPPETSRILQHRFQGYLWNLHDAMDAPWHVSDIYPDQVRTTRFELQEAFAVAHNEGCVSYQRTIIDAPAYHVDAITMDHHTPVIAYLVREKARHNVDLARLEKSGLSPGPWMQWLKNIRTEEAQDQIVIGGQNYSLEALRGELLVEIAGDSVAYLTDFLLDEGAMDRLAEFLKGCDTVVCEGQYRHADLELAHRHFHMTTVLSAQLAKRVAARRLILIHLSRRYQEPEWLEMLREAREWFPAAEFPPGWEMG